MLIGQRVQSNDIAVGASQFVSDNRGNVRWGYGMSVRDALQNRNAHRQNGATSRQDGARGPQTHVAVLHPP